MTNTMWGGRFAASPAEVMEDINASIEFDKRLWRHDISASKAHVAMLGATGILTAKEAKEIAGGFDKILGEIEAGEFKFSRALEDIHLNIESRLRELIGPIAGKLHTARSRNDQVATDFKLYVKDEIAAIDRAFRKLQLALATKALEYAGAVMPGFTHMQTAQPITFGHHLLAYVEMLARDRGRFADTAKRLAECPLGSAALAGTSFPIGRGQEGEGAGFCGANRELARGGLSPRFRAGASRRRSHRCDASVAACGGDRAVALAAIRSRPPLRQIHHRLVDHAAEAQF